MHYKNCKEEINFGTSCFSGKCAHTKDLMFIHYSVNRRFPACMCVNFKDQSQVYDCCCVSITFCKCMGCVCVCWAGGGGIPIRSKKGIISLEFTIIW